MDEYREINIEGHRLAAILICARKSGTPVFFLHGIGGSIYFWTQEITSLFQSIGPCYSLSLPGHFPAVFPKGFTAASISAERIAGLLSRAIHELVGNRKVLLVGHSTGGFAALSMASHTPRVAAGVISIAGFARGKWTGALGFNQWLVRRGPIGRSLFKMIYRLGRTNPVVFRTFWHVYAHDQLALLKHPNFKAVVGSSFPCLQMLDLDAMADYFIAMPDIDITACLPDIRIPTCAIAGRQDPIVPPGQSALIVEKVNKARLVLIEGSGHLPFFERPAEYRKAMEAWLDENRSSF